ncbi:MAG: oligopeptide transporter, OPT family [Bacteroidetes bacterium]|nr:oligopeptide transporter, OPT family [Bacteroidota bacterium]
MASIAEKKETAKPHREFKPFIAANDLMPEFTPKAIILGSLFGIIFGASTVYMGLKVGLTVSASIPIAVLAISIFKRFGNSTILENNIVQTIGSAGESVAAGVVFTVPALLFLAGGMDYFQYLQIFILALLGGVLGVLFMVPLRRSLIVKEHGNLIYPEGTACADVLIAGEKGGSMAKRVFAGLGVAFLYKLLMSVFGFWRETPSIGTGKDSIYPNAQIPAEISPELLGVGYVIGFRQSAILVAGGLLSYLVFIPLISVFGESVTSVVKPGLIPLAEMTGNEIRQSYVRYIMAGAVTAGGVITMIKTFPMLVSSLRDSFKDLRANGKDTKVTKLRTEWDLPITFTAVGAVAMIVIIAALPNMPGDLTARIGAGVLIVVFGFLFVTVSSRIVGLIGSSNNPISGMTIATLMGTCLVFIAMGWTGEVYEPIAIVVGAIVCIAAANAGATSQDLKTGFLVGGTPIKQQYGLMIGVVASSLIIGATVLLLHNSLTIGSDAVPAPQATLMATVIKGLLNQELPWGFVICGMAIAVVVELCGVRSLGFAVGAYLPLSTTVPIFIGGLVKYFIDKNNSDSEESETGSGILFASGLIAGGALMGIVIAVLKSIELDKTAAGVAITLSDVLNTHWGEEHTLGAFIGISVFAVMAYMLYKNAMAKDDQA